MSNQIQVAEAVSPLTRERQVRNAQNGAFLKTPQKGPIGERERETEIEREREGRKVDSLSGSQWQEKPYQSSKIFSASFLSFHFQSSPRETRDSR